MKLQILLIISLLVLIQNVCVYATVATYTCIPMDKVFENYNGDAICQNSDNYYSYTFFNTTSSTCQYLRGLGQTCQIGVSGMGCDGYLRCNQTCQYTYYLEIGDACNSNYPGACNSEYCTDGKCSSQPGGCQQMYDCSVGQYCNATTGTCVTQKNEGDACITISDNSECHYGLFCDGVTCVPLFSKQLNEECSQSNQCDYDNGLYCEDYQCVKYSKSASNCITDISVCNSNEWCNGVTGACETYQTISAEAKNITLDYFACMRQYGCSDDDMYSAVFSPAACSMKHCGTLVCQYLALNPSDCDTSIYDNPLCAGYEPTEAPTETPSSSNQLTSGLFFTFILLFISFF